MHIVYGKAFYISNNTEFGRDHLQMSSGRLFRRQVVDICPRNAEPPFISGFACHAAAPFFDRPEVMRQ